MPDFFPSVAVVILNWNGRAFLEQFLPSVSGSQYPNLRIYLADNASTDDSVAFVRGKYPAITLLENTRNTGYAEGYNQALSSVQADYYVLLNQDVEVKKDWLLPVIALMESNPLIGACQPKILSFHQPERFEYAGAAGGWLDRWGYTFCRGRIFEELETDQGQYDQPLPVFWASGAAMFIRGELYHRAGGLDAYFFAHMEEIDLCWRLQRLGYQVWCCPQSVVYHVGGGSLPRGNPRKTFLNYRNNLIMLHKNLHGFQRAGTLVVRFFLDGISGFKALCQGHPREVWAILKAHRAFYGWLFTKQDTGHPGKYPGGPSRLKSLSGVYPRSIVWQYFIRRRKTFSSLRIRDK